MQNTSSHPAHRPRANSRGGAEQHPEEAEAAKTGRPAVLFADGGRFFRQEEGSGAHQQGQCPHDEQPPPGQLQPGQRGKAMAHRAHCKQQDENACRHSQPKKKSFPGVFQEQGKAVPSFFVLHGAAPLIRPSPGSRPPRGRCPPLSGWGSLLCSGRWRRGSGWQSGSREPGR